MADVTRDEFDRRLDEIQRRFWGGGDRPLPTREELDAAHAALVELAREPSTRDSRERRMAIHAVAEVLERTYAARKLPVPEQT
jgi:hypothetical protein